MQIEALKALKIGSHKGPPAARSGPQETAGEIGQEHQPGPIRSSPPTLEGAIETVGIDLID